jgi:hypothetical protein
MRGKNTNIYFFYFWFKNHKKKSQNLKIAGNFPNILFALTFKIFYMKKKKKSTFTTLTTEDQK